MHATRTDTVLIPVIDGEVVQPASEPRRNLAPFAAAAAFLLLLVVVGYAGYVAADLTGLSR